jgi:hypothetical protein
MRLSLTPDEAAHRILGGVLTPPATSVAVATAS